MIIVPEIKCKKPPSRRNEHDEIVPVLMPVMLPVKAVPIVMLSVKMPFLPIRFAHTQTVRARILFPTRRAMRRARTHTDLYGTG